MLQDGRSRVRFPIKSLDFSIHLFLPAALSTQPLTNEYQEFYGGKEQPVRKADNLTAIYEPIS
jgi:hypothetical protein